MQTLFNTVGAIISKRSQTENQKTVPQTTNERGCPSYTCWDLKVAEQFCQNSKDIYSKTETAKHSFTTKSQTFWAVKILLY